MKYHQQTKNPLWQKKRLEVLSLHDFTCQNCGSSETELHVHHPYYTRGSMIWEYPSDDLMCLCSICHKHEHAIDEKLKKIVSLLNIDSKCRVVGYVNGIIDDKFTPCSLEELEGAINSLGFLYSQEMLDTSTPGPVDANFFQINIKQKTYFWINIIHQLEKFKGEFVDGEYSKDSSSVVDCADAIIDFINKSKMVV